MMREQTFDYGSPSAPRRPARVVDIFASAGFLCALAWFCVLSYVDRHGAQYSNRVFAPPAMLASLVLSIWLMLRLKRVPFAVRVVAFPLAFLAGYALAGMGFIVLNS